MHPQLLDKALRALVNGQVPELLHEDLRGLVTGQLPELLHEDLRGLVISELHPPNFAWSKLELGKPHGQSQ